MIWGFKGIVPWTAKRWRSVSRELVHNWCTIRVAHSEKPWTNLTDCFVVFVFDCPTGAAGRHTGILADDSAVSSDLPEFMMIPGK